MGLQIKTRASAIWVSLTCHPRPLKPHPHSPMSHTKMSMHTGTGWSLGGSHRAVARQPIFKPRSHKLLTLAQIDIDSNWSNIHRADGKIRCKSACRRGDMLSTQRSLHRSVYSNWMFLQRKKSLERMTAWRRYDMLFTNVASHRVIFFFS